MRKGSTAGKDRWLVLAERYLQKRRLDKSGRAFFIAEALRRRGRPMRCRALAYSYVGW